MNTRTREWEAAAFCLMAILLLAASSWTDAAATNSRTYTTDADFDEGVLVNVEHNTVADQLQLSDDQFVLPFIWVPNLDNTVSKVDTDTGKELARYRTVPTGVSGSPSRTTVDQNGNVWFGNRAAGTAVKIGLFEAGGYVDRNMNGTIETSHDLNDDGDITGAELLPWGQDECVLLEVVLVPGSEGPYVPGTAHGLYSGTPGPRSFAIDASNNLWAGCHGTSNSYYIDGTTGAILGGPYFSPGHSPYGGLIDGYGVFWSSGGGSNNVARIDPTGGLPPTITQHGVPGTSYGMAADFGLDHVFVSHWTFNTFSRFDISVNPPVLEWTKPTYASSSRGVAVTPADNNVWIANSGSDDVTRYDNNGNLLATIPVGDQPTGVSIDSNGKVWVVMLGDNTIRRIDPADNTVDLIKDINAASGHYGYSDMTGISIISIDQGKWTVVYDSGEPEAEWERVWWTDFVPAGMTLAVKARSSLDLMTWSAWESATNGTDLSATPPGQYLEVEVELERPQGETDSPILYDLTIEWSPPCVTVEWGDPYYDCPEVWIPIMISDVVGTTDIIGVDLIVTYDPAVVEPDGVDFAGTVLEGLGWTYLDYTPVPGEYRIGLAGTVPIADLGVLAYLEFDVLDLNCGACTDLILDVLFNEGIPEVCDIDPLTWCVPPGTAEGVVEFWNCNCCMPPMPDTEVCLFDAAGAPVDCVMTDVDGMFVFDGMCLGDCYTVVPDRPCYAYDEDHGISTLDAAHVLQYFVMCDPLDNCPIYPMEMYDGSYCPPDDVYPQQVAADVTVNGSIHSFDASIILKYIVGHDVSMYAVGCWTFYCRGGSLRRRDRQLGLVPRGRPPGCEGERGGPGRGDGRRGAWRDGRGSCDDRSLGRVLRS